MSFSTWSNEAVLQQLMESAPVAIVTVNHDGIIVYTNTRLEEMFGYAQEEVLGQPVEMLIPERFRQIHHEHRSGYMSEPHTRAMGTGMDLAGRRKNGSEFPLEAGLSHIAVDDDMLVMASITDMTRRKQTEENLESRVRQRTRELERRRQVSEGLRDTLTILNSNRPLEEILDHIVAQACRLLYADASAIYNQQATNQSLSLRASYGIDGEFILMPGTSGATEHVALDYESAVVHDGNGEIGQPADKMKTHLSTVERPNPSQPVQTLPDANYRAVLSVPLVVTDEIYGNLMLYYKEPRKFSAEEIELAATVGDQATLAIENARLRTQVERSAIAAERNRIARDLHDSVSQTLFSASLIAEVLPRLWQRDRNESERRLDELRQLTRGALAEMRSLLLELRPATMRNVEIGELLRQLTEAITGRARVPVMLNIEGSCELPPDVKVSFYHIAQEALNNVAKHARAASTRVDLFCTPDKMELLVKDDGRGFVLGEVTAEHLGLTIMRERAESIGAAIEIQSQLEQGTEVRVTWPAGVSDSRLTATPFSAKNRNEEIS